jgi:D-alanine-D-alanine ligase
MSVQSLQGKVVGVLLGGDSAERDVSLQSGATVVAALESVGQKIRVVDPKNADWMKQLQGVDFVFNALHGPGGEDGVMQGALQAMGLPYTGSGVLGSALAMDKKRSKQLWQGIGLSTGGFVTLSADTNWQGVIDNYTKVFVKPACEGSSIGMASADNAADLRGAFDAAASYSGEVIAEAFIDGPEYTVAVLGDETLPSIRLETQNEFYDYDAKYLSEETQYHCPSSLTEDEETHLSRLALEAFSSLGCLAWGRVDFMRDSAGRFYVLEVNTIPGMTSHSLVPMAASVAGMSMEMLVQKIIECSLVAHRG